MSDSCEKPISQEPLGSKTISLAFPPEGFEILARGKNTYLLGRNCRPLLDFLLKDQRIKQLLHSITPDISAGGRGEIVTIDIPGENTGKGVLRKGIRGGIFKKILGSTYWGKLTRMFDEALIADFALRSGLPVPEVLLAGREPFAPYCYKGWIITREIENSYNLADFFNNYPAALSAQNIQEKNNILIELASIVCRMHDKGIIHADLHVKNILVQENAKGKKRVFLIDFDKSKVVQHMTIKQRMINVMRLFRSFEKQPGLARFLDSKDKKQFLKTYFHGNQEKISQAEHMLKQRKWRQYLHRLGWHIEGYK